MVGAACKQGQSRLGCALAQKVEASYHPLNGFGSGRRGLGNDSLVDTPARAPS